MCNVVDSVTTDDVSDQVDEVHSRMNEPVVVLENHNVAW